MAKNLLQAISELQAQCAERGRELTDTPRSDSAAVEFDPHNNFCFKKGSKWVPLEDAQHIERDMAKAVSKLQGKERFEALRDRFISELNHGTNGRI